LQALQNASVVTDPANPQIVQKGGPADIQQLVGQLGKKSSSKVPVDDDAFERGRPDLEAVRT
jgi:hypothetical protein